jgi:hypothetical protein
VFKSETFVFAVFIVTVAVFLPLATSPKPGPVSQAGHVYSNGTSVTTASSPQATAPFNLQPQPAVTPAPNAPQQQQQQLTQVPVIPAIVAPVAVPAEKRAAPITYIIPYITSLLGISARFVARLPSIAITLVKLFIVFPLYYPAALILALLRPVTLLLEVLYSIFLKTPFAILAWFMTEAIYPLYVFTGVAALCGAAIGVSASLVPTGIQAVLTRVSGATTAKPEFSALSSAQATSGGYSSRQIRMRQEGSVDSIVGRTNALMAAAAMEQERGDSETIRGLDY